MPPHEHPYPEIVVDAFVITGCETSGGNAIKITLSEPPSDDMMVTGNYTLNPRGATPVSVIKESAVTYIIRFEDEFINRSLNSLIIKKLCSLNGNCSTDIEIPFTPAWAATGDVVISEIMADPLPVVSLPGKEYLELTNRTNIHLVLKDGK